MIELSAIDIDRRGTTRTKDEGDGDFEKVYFGRLVRSCCVYGVNISDNNFFTCFKINV